MALCASSPSKTPSRRRACRHTRMCLKRCTVHVARFSISQGTQKKASARPHGGVRHVDTDISDMSPRRHTTR